MKLHTFRVTISVPTDVSDSTVQAVKTYVAKKCHYAYIVCERGTTGKRHLHALVCLKSPMEGNDLIGNFWKHYVQPFHSDAIRKHAMNIHVQYDHTWYDEYLNKEQQKEVIWDDYDRDEVAKFFPTDEEQERLMQAVVTGRSDNGVGDPYIDRLVNQWTEYDPSGSDYEDAGRYINYRMYVARDITCIRDVRRLSQLCWTMYCYRNKRVDNSTEFIRLGNQMTGNCL